MKDTRRYRRGQIWMIDFGETEGSVMSRIHPGVITQNNTGNVYSPCLIVRSLTSYKPGKTLLPTHVIIQPADVKGPSDDFHTSVFQAEQVRTIPKDSQVLRCMGIISPEKMKELSVAICIAEDLINI
jgi:mRNA-degrading endonuclease toxin of MazEF toxin-antitoxin module